MTYKTLLISILPAFLLVTANAQSSSETRSYIRSFPVGRETTLEIINKYGTVQITSWKKDSAYIRAEVKAYGQNPEKITAMFDGIDIEINGAGDALKAHTVFTQNINRLFEGFKGMTSKFISYDSRVEINYYVSLPEYMNLRIDNKYGDVYMEDCTGTFTGAVSNGSFRAANLRGQSSVVLSFCDATIRSITNGKIEASFSEITAAQLGNLKINSTSSRYEIADAGEITFESRRDKIFIDTVAAVMGNAYFTDFAIKYLKKEISLASKYGNMEIELINSGFEVINLNTGYTDVKFRFEQNSSYKLDIRHINAFVSLPAQDNRTEEKILDTDKKEYMIFGSVGSSPGSRRVKIDATRGQIYIK